MIPGSADTAGYRKAGIGTALTLAKVAVVPLMPNARAATVARCQLGLLQQRPQGEARTPRDLSE